MRLFGRRGAIWAALLTVLLIAAAPSRADPPATTPFSEVFAQLAARLLGVVVNISTTQAGVAGLPKDAPQGQAPAPGSPLDQFFQDFFGENGGPGGPNGLTPPIASLGSGFIIDPSGLIVTNNHVIANAEQITVTLSDNTSLQARVVGRDPVSDLALLKVDAKTPLPAAIWGDSAKTRVGDWVLAIGNPFGLGGTVTSGIISATARDIHSGPYDDFLQTDASINRGNSGGPMFNLAGQVIGINTAIYSPSGGSIGIGFAIPSSAARPIIDQLEATGKVERGWLGARIQPVTDGLAAAVGLDKSRGAMIAAIDPASPAAQAKLEPGDVILAYDGKPIERSRQLPLLVAGTPPDKMVKLSIWRERKQREVTLKVAALDQDHPPPPPARSGKAQTAAQRRRARSQAGQADRRFAQAVFPARRGQGRGHHRGAGKHRRGDARAASRRSGGRPRPGPGRDPGRGAAEGRRRDQGRRQRPAGPGRARRQHPFCGAARGGWVGGTGPAIRLPRAPGRATARAGGGATRPPWPWRGRGWLP